MKKKQIKELLQNKMVLAALLMVLTAGTALAGVVAMRRDSRGEGQRETDPAHISQTEEDNAGPLLQLPKDDPDQPGGLPEGIQSQDGLLTPEKDRNEAAEGEQGENKRPVQSDEVEVVKDRTEVSGAEQMPADSLTAEENSHETLVDGEGAVIYEPGQESEAVSSMPLSFTANSTIAWPVAGNIILDYSMDTTTYFPTLKQYKCNPGILIQAEIGQPALAAVRGIVTVVGSNEELGNFIMMDLGDGYSILYGQLENIGVSIGQTVEQGAVLGQIAAPTKYYVVEGPNMYLEMRHHQKPVDPLDYIR